MSRLSLAVVLFLALLAPACGGSGRSSSTAGTGSSPTPSVSGSTKAPVSVALPNVPHCRRTHPNLITESTPIRPTSGPPGTHVELSGPTGRNENWSFASASKVEVWWNTNVSGSEVANAPPLKPGPVVLLATDWQMDRCRFTVRFDVPNARPGKYRIFVFLFFPHGGYGQEGIQTFALT